MAKQLDLLAICLLVTSAVLSVWLGVWGPTNTTLWKDWQPLMASIIALVGAALVYRGATLAYNASMAKVDHDRAIDAREVRRKTRGICLRAVFALHIVESEADLFMKSIATLPVGPSHRTYLENLTFRTAEDLNEAWGNLDVFPQELAVQFADIKIMLLNLSDCRNESAASQFETSSVYQHRLVDKTKKFLGQLMENCRKARETAYDMAKNSAT
jgi:hypothetical protein